MKICFLTCSALPTGTPDDEILARSGRAKNLEIDYRAWDSDEDWATYDSVLIRSTWDYHRNLDIFLATLKRIGEATRLVNSFDVIKWNSDKHYLQNLDIQRVPTVPTLWIEDTTNYPVPDPFDWFRCDEIVVKPTVSITAELTYRFAKSERGYVPEAIEECLVRSSAMVQPFLKSIETEGELSLVYWKFNSRVQFQHAVLKLPKPGDFRVQTDHGGSVVRLFDFCNETNVRKVAESALHCVEAEWNYARVDIVDWKAAPKVSELELIEPNLFFGYAEESANLFWKSISL